MDSYHVLNLVGEGSYGRVYKGRKKFTGQVVALKFMPKVGRSEKELRNLKREIEIMRDLQHPNIVQLFDSFETETEVVVVTEYAEGQLFQILEDDGNLPEKQVRGIACQLVSALYYLHSHRILHRDMKPQNILLGKSGVVKLCDFGFARAMSVSTLVLTSIKGTPLYMSPEIVEEKPYDHTADLWALGCILYELHTGVPPFYTNSIFHLVQLIVREQIRWPDTMSDSCMSFLKGLLTKDPQRRLSWPDLLHHPFVADGVLVSSATNLFSPLTVTPSPDVMALKLKQVAEKSAPASGESRFLRKVREQLENKKKEADGGKNKKDDSENMDPAIALASPNVCLIDSWSCEATGASGQLVGAAGSQSMTLKSRATSKQRGQISRDYEQEFPSVEVGPRLVRRGSKDRAATLSRQLTGIGVVNVQQIEHLLKVLQNLILTPDPEKSRYVTSELELPQVLFDMIRDFVSSSDFVEEKTSVLTLGKMIKCILIYWEKHFDWVEGEPRLEELTKPFKTILIRPDLKAVAPLAASVLSLFTQTCVDVFVELEILTSLLKTDPSTLMLPPPSWGLYDGLLSLLLHILAEHEHSSLSSELNPLLLADLWKRVGSSLASTTPNLDFLSADGFYSFLSILQFILTKDPFSCIALFSDETSKCVYTLCWLLGNNCLHFLGRRPSGSSETEPSRHTLSTLSCHLLCFPFALDLPSPTLSTVLQVYDSCHIASSLLQVIQTFPHSLLELPLSLLSRLMLCDPEHSISHIGEGAGFFSSPQTPLTRTASSLLSDLLQQDVLWDSAVELLNLLSQVARCSSQLASPRIHVEAAPLQQALSHPYNQMRAAACRFLGNFKPLRPNEEGTLQVDVFRRMINCLMDSCPQVRRMACRAVGNWLGYIAAKFRMGGNCCDTSGRDSENNNSKQRSLHMAAASDSSFSEDEQRRWTEEACRSAAALTCLLSDADAVTRRHCCTALGNLVNVDAVVSVLEEGVYSSLLRAAYKDSDGAVRNAAEAALKLCRDQQGVK